ncbi:acetylornithine deacetylase (ArgE) [Anaeromyxobacter dehalogenans 2CP-1]|uniref:Acetylornithine deacetylase (ArgE) n=1 Tax=Anaeromyxobacter dehalogenans (strain ATCC BAA-258 / DSM 21875 / 2CP-1) TaxID=455488 RepID=B8JC30_ANAD2|nr:acetylornithine deacetylase [Anaeromyxobacter dehalogenans]ACL63952.1 acetylornithine deacetylase (ArgE) [Anaeromyxobacter dehalogenans 2CP-1]
MDLVPLLRSLVALDTTSARTNLPALDLLEREAHAAGFVTRRQRWTDAAGVEKGNLVCRRGPDVPGGLALVGHTDCVPFDPEWKEALSGEVVDGRLVGRGSADTKAFLAAALTAARAARPGRLPLTLVFTADEEIGCLGAKKLLAEGALHPAHAIVGEPTRLTPIRAHKGYCAVEVVVSGIEGHSAYPEVGASAIHHVGRLWPELEAIGADLTRETDQAFSPPYTTWNVGVIRGGKARNIIAGECRFTFEWRPLPGHDPRRALRLLEDACARLAAASGGKVAVKVIPLRTDAAAVTPPGAEIVRFLEAESGNEAATVPFGTELPELIGMGAEACVFGPGDIREAHRTGESVPLDQVERAVTILGNAIARFCA